MASDIARNRPHIKILEQPAAKALRFRYECEGRSAGSLPGANSTQEVKTYPTIQIVNYRGPVVVVVSCITKDLPYRPHPHKLVGKDGCKRGICTMTVNCENMICTFSNLGIQCVKKKDVDEALREREVLRVDPFRTGFDHRNQASNIDLNSVRLCFQAFIEGSEKDKFTQVLTPVVSDAITDKKAMAELVICKMSSCSGSADGKTEIILLCEKIAKDDIDLVFSEEQNGRIVWEALGEFQPNDVHKQVAITFRTPPYYNKEIVQPVEVRLQLRRKSDLTMSEPRAFQYTPLDLDPQGLQKKRKKVSDDSLQKYLSQNTTIPSMRPVVRPLSNVHSVPSTSGVNIMPPRLVITPKRFIKQEEPPRHPTPIYAFTSANSFVQQPINFYQNIAQTSIPSQSQSPFNDRMQVSPNPLQMDRALTNQPSPMSTDTAQTSCLTEAMAVLGNFDDPNLAYLNPAAASQQMCGVKEKDQNQEEMQLTSLDFNLSLDSNDFKNLLPGSDASLNALVSTMSNNSLHFSSLDSFAPETPDSFNLIQNEIMPFTPMGQNLHHQQ
uniref:RHD domain-containing protein n=1 Tax=Strigamia maritima TaxID=126957 RepID=T1JKR2_STRMM